MVKIALSTLLFEQPLAYHIEVKEQLELKNLHSMDVGVINVEAVPCSDKGIEYNENDDTYVDSPSELIGRKMHFLIKVNGCRGLPARFTDVYCAYKIFLDREDTHTDVISDTSNPDFNHRKMFTYHPVTPQLVEYFKEGYVTIKVMGKQMEKRPYTRASGRATKQLLNQELKAQTDVMMEGFKMNGRIVEPSQQSIIVELLLMKKQQAKQQQRIVSK